MASKKDRQRQLARDAYQRRLQRQAARARRTRQLWVGGTSAVVVIAVALGLTAALGGFSSPKATAASKATPAATASAAASPSPTPAPGPTSAIVDGKCVYTPSGTAARKVSLPPARPDTTAKDIATIKTNRGTVVISLLASKAPCTVGSFVSLADQKYFSNTPCHRLTTSGIFVLQCGDPTGTGTGGPGYEFYTENLTGATYPAGTLAMANSSQSSTPGTDTNGSQFFLVYKKTPLPPNYTPFGTVTSGLKVLTAIAAKGSDNSNGPGDGKPKESVQIQSVKISKA